MASIGRIDQAMLVLREKLQRLNEKSGQGAAATGRQDANASVDPLVSLRQMVRQRKISREILRKALVRTLLANSMGDELVGSLEFQSIADQVSELLEQSEQGQELLDRALAELE